LLENADRSFKIRCETQPILLCHVFLDCEIMKSNNSNLDRPMRATKTNGQITTDRRTFVKASAAATVLPLILTNPASAFSYRANSRPLLGCIGTGSRWGGVGPAAMEFADCAIVCDVDKRHRERAAKLVEEKLKKVPDAVENYQDVLSREDIDVVTIVTPDHWHAKIAIAALRSGKHVYCEKPLTLTIKEGQEICKVVKETGKTFQVGTQQRSEMGLRFLQAVALVKDGRIGKVQKVHVAIGGAPTSVPLPVIEAPSGLNWDLWLGQAPKVDYRANDKYTRCHYEFRWWYEYSGGKMTDWGAHHVDIAQWAIDQNGDGQGPLSVEPLEAEHPVAFINGQPAESDRYNTATKFRVKVIFENDIEMQIRHNCKDLGFDNGIMFEGTKGRFLVNRGKIVGKPIDALAEHALADDLMKKLYKNRQPGLGNAHMRNFFDCIEDGGEPISDVFTHHRALTTCHLANIAIRLNRKLIWDSKSEQILADDEAGKWLNREPRTGFEIDA